MPLQPSPVATKKYSKRFPVSPLLRMLMYARRRSGSGKMLSNHEATLALSAAVGSRHGF